ncbi:MAG: DUF2177 family protein [Candidatus Babeliales bacterium]
MNASHIIKLFVISYPIYLLIDFIWFGVLMQDTYKHYLEPISRTIGHTLQSRWPAAIIVWALIVLGAIIFVLPRAVNTGLVYSFCWGALYGLVVYGTYNLTNYAILEQWPLAIVFIDSGWGMVANGILLVLLRWLSSYNS